jgi:hypothetical protein
MPRSIFPFALVILLALPCVALPAAAQESVSSPALPDAPQGTTQLKVRDRSLPPPPTAVRPVIINGRPYERPTQRQFFVDYLKDSYGLPAFARSTVRTLYNFGLDQPKGWGQDAPGFAQRFGSNVAITAINGNVRYGMEELFHEDLRYIPCHGCNAKHKIENALLAEFTARHERDGHRFFTLTPTVADFSGPIIAHAFWYPAGFNPFGGVVATRTVFATRVGSHLFREFVLERRHYDPKEYTAPVPTELPPPPPTPTP